MSSTIRAESISGFVVSSLARRQRPASVVDELESLVGQSSAVLLRRATENVKSRQLSREALVTVFRYFYSSGSHDESNIVFMALVERLSGSIANKLKLWSSIQRSQEEDVRQTILIGLYDYFCCQDSGEELWECNFKTCFDLRLLTILGKLTRGEVPTVSASQVSDEDLSEEIFEPADPSAAAEMSSVEVRDALNFLDRRDSRLGKTFYLKFFAELSEKEIADIMEVSERTVRNWITESRKELRQYVAES